MNNHKLFSDKTDLYARSRPRYPRDIYEYLSRITPGRKLAWDCATGNGQVANDLIEYFDRVEATDVSPEQIDQTSAIEGVEFSVAEAESTTFGDHVFDIACVGQALHWFDYDRFWPELDRVLKPGGVFAAWGYVFPELPPDLRSVLEETLYPAIEPCWSDRNKLLWNHYRDVAIPYSRLETPDITFSIDWNLAELLAYIHTWSAVRKCMEQLGDRFFIKTCERMQERWGDPSCRRPIMMDFCFLASQKAA